jgi:hypothetical protein
LRRHILLWIGVWFLVIGAVSVLVPPSFVVAAVHEEVNMTRDLLGAESTDRIIVWANQADNWIANLVLHHNAVATRDHGSKWSRRLNQALRTLVIILYMAIFRLGVILQWLVPVLVLIGAAALDGLLVRQKKLETFGYHSPVLYNFSAHSGITLVCGPLVLC